MRNRLLRATLRERFHITLTTSESFDGLLDEWDHDHLIFIDAGTTVDIDGTGRLVRKPVDGKLFIQRARIAYMQQVVSGTDIAGH